MFKKPLLSLFLFSTLFVCGQIVNIPDPNFKAALLAHSPVIDLNGDGEIQVSEASSFDADLILFNKNITDLTGISDFISLTHLNCNKNQIKELDVSKNTMLTKLSCGDNQLKQLDISNLTSLKEFQCTQNQISELDLSFNTELSIFYCYTNLLTFLDVSKNTKLTLLNCASNLLSSLNVTNNIQLTTLDCSINSIKALNVGKNTALHTLNIGHNQLTSIDLSQNILLTHINFQVNRFTDINFKNNSLLESFFGASNNLTTIDLTNNPSLKYFALSSNKLRSVDLRNGNNKTISTVYLSSLDNNPNLTCISVDDPAWSSLNWSWVDPQIKFSSNCACGVFKLNIDSLSNIQCTESGQINVSATGNDGPFQFSWLTNPTTDGPILSTDVGGIYALKVTDSNACESLNQIVVKGPKTSTSFELNSNLHSGSFRPGRTSVVNLSVANEGCESKNGEVTLSFHGPVNYESSSILPLSQTANSVTWNFENLSYSMDNFLSNLHFRVDTLAQVWDQICFEVRMTTVDGNLDTLISTTIYCFHVIASYDPNDKQVFPQGVCAEHYTLKNQALTYTVRFQNTGNAPAIDVFLLDSLSPSFDLKTLRVLSSSHQPMITEIVGDRILKFDFKNINLADILSDEEASKGFVTFEISPYLNLLDGTLIENNAGIYFDFNPPVITNTTWNTLTSVLPEMDTTIVFDTLSLNYTFMAHAYTEAGIYKRYLKSNTGCDSLIILHLAEPIVGITEHRIDELVQVYPNPTTGKFTLSFNRVLDHAQVKITDLQGRLVQELKITDAPGVSIELNEAPGMYFIHISTENKTMSVLPLVKR